MAEDDRPRRGSTARASANVSEKRDFAAAPCRPWAQSKAALRLKNEEPANAGSPTQDRISGLLAAAERVVTARIAPLRVVGADVVALAAGVAALVLLMTGLLLLLLAAAIAAAIGGIVGRCSH